MYTKRDITRLTQRIILADKINIQNVVIKYFISYINCCWITIEYNIYESLNIIITNKLLWGEECRFGHFHIISMLFWATILIILLWAQFDKNHTRNINSFIAKFRKNMKVWINYSKMLTLKINSDKYLNVKTNLKKFMKLKINMLICHDISN